MFAFEAILLAGFFVSTIFSAPSTGVDDECNTSVEERKMFGECCKVQFLDTPSKDEQDVTEECLALVNNGSNEGDKKSLSSANTTGYDCVNDCFFIKMGFMGADKKINTAKIIDDIQKFYTGTWYTVETNALTKCIELLKTTNERCISHLLAVCTIRETYLNCPSDSWTTSDSCQKSKDRLLQCPKMIPTMRN